jgi:O-antigen/teichoic acid export membrane protein
MSNGAPVMRWIPSFLKPFVARVLNSPLGYRLARGALWSFVGTVISQGCGFAATVLVARVLGKEGFGELGVIQNTVGMFGVFAGFGLGLTATKHVAEFRLKDPAKAGRIMALCTLFAVGSGGLIALGLALAAPWLAANTLAAPHLAELLQVGALLLLLNALNGTQTGALSGLEAFKTITIVNLWSGLSRFPLMVGGAYLAGVIGAVWGLVVSTGINWLLNHLALRRESRRAGVPFGVFRGCAQEWNVLYGFSLPALLSGAMVTPVQWGGMAMLVNQPGGYAEMGIFSAVLLFQGVMLFLGATMNAPLLAMVAHEQASSKSPLSRVNMLLTWSLGVFMALPLLSFPELVPLIYGQDFAGESYARTFVLMILVTCIIVYKQGLARVLTARNLLWFGFLSNFLWGVLLLSGAFFLVKWGAVGLSIAYLFAYTLVTIAFVPVYLRLGLVPKSTIISLEAIVIWAVVIGLAIMAFFHPPIALRFIMLVVAIILTIAAFKRLAKPA